MKRLGVFHNWSPKNDKRFFYLYSFRQGLIIVCRKAFLRIFSHLFQVYLFQCSKKQQNNQPVLTVSWWVFFSLLGLVTILWRPPTAHNRWNHPGTQFSWSELKQQLGQNLNATMLSLTVSWSSSFEDHTGLEALPSKKKWSIDGTGVPGFLRPVW